MPAKKSWGEHGTVRRYRQGGCDDLIGGNPGEGDRCARCKLAQREFNQGRRAGIANPAKGNVITLDKRRRGAKTGDNAPVSGNAQPDDDEKPSVAKRKKPPGSNELAVVKQLEPFKDDQPIRYEMALACARILDDEERVSLHATTIRQLEAIVDKLTGGRKTKSKGRLAMVKKMTAKAR